MSSEMMELVQDVRNRFFWRVSPDDKRNHLIDDDAVRAVISLCDSLLARTEAGADDDKSAWCDVHKMHDQCPHTDLAVDESVRLRQLFAASQEQVRVLTEMVERGQKHHERMMKLLHPQDASVDAENSRRYLKLKELFRARFHRSTSDYWVIEGECKTDPRFFGEDAEQLTLDAALDAMQAKEAK